ncbi:hypothetical protein SKAU_G00151450 [Synaphobranchus kaupii]|uniref:Uncharacterized protein n=1 Tax=Synaphobranchus kaupii TaxID=118154 RepID=A0A9Q1IYU7_SYNKA|nr:hypothetical protein SKAU_G00151450 [Synaphobranchus kaupii]
MTLDEMWQPALAGLAAVGAAATKHTSLPISIRGPLVLPKENPAPLYCFTSNRLKTLSLLSVQPRSAALRLRTPPAHSAGEPRLQRRVLCSNRYINTGP